jgi:hypothetical protein
MGFGAAVLFGRDRREEGKTMTEPVHGICPYYLFWWERKRLKKNVDETFWQKP